MGTNTSFLRDWQHRGGRQPRNPAGITVSPTGLWEVMQIPGVASALTFELKKNVFGHSRASHSSRATPKPLLQQIALPAPAPRHPPVRMTPGRNRGLDLSADQFPQQLLPHSPVGARPLSSKAGARLEGSVLLVQRDPAGVRTGRTEPGGGGVTGSPGRLQPQLLPVSPASAEPPGPVTGTRLQREPAPWWNRELSATRGSTASPSPVRYSVGDAKDTRPHPGMLLLSLQRVRA